MKLFGPAADPLWYKDAIIYETHVRAFFDGNNDGIGDFPGLIQKLDYIQDLGVTCVWLLPFFPSPLRDDGYDIADYLNVNPSYGTLDDIKSFIREAHKRNLHVLIELVVNHTSDQHPWFQAARKAPPGSPERELYVWNDSDRKYADARIIFTDTEKSNWTWDSEAQAYYWHRFFSHQPDLNFDNPETSDRLFNVMRFWLDMGVDGMRLDAVPYLYEREGTNCENLPETHVAIKRLRREMDSLYSNRMILAEANQWPTDVRPYFGDGDECHMAFHFPLMPRLFMALRMEDRHPITDILAQTPDLPPSCQWALFLRNHDELTLEMVTDEERDYMYLAYSADPRMRLNLGIRRRLAPLMDNNRRRVELLNSILLSFPGTPVIYYGDELGMGDNVYLGDRNGVRTPMQWSEDRNAGFSRANPSRLYSPVIMDPVYSYEAINVETQQADPSSLLNWMRNMIGLRKLFKVFGRGTIKFLYPENRKVLAYVREYGAERVLCVANLSRFAQPVALDLSGLAGLTPVEMLGYTEFPRIRRDLYPLTVAPYGFYWFELQAGMHPAEAWADSAENEVRIAGGLLRWESLFGGTAGQRLETSVLPRFLAAQRWFGGKTRNIAEVKIADWGLLSRDSASTAALLILEAMYEDGASEIYAAPFVLTRVETSSPGNAEVPVVCYVLDGKHTATLRDGMSDDSVCRNLLQTIAAGREVAMRSGAIRGIPASSLRQIIGPDASSLEIRRRGGEQSNTSVSCADKAVLKLFRRLQPGPNPDVEIGRHLTEGGFRAVPRFAGTIEYTPAAGESSAVCVLQEWVHNKGDGWSWTLERLREYFDRSLGKGLPPNDAAPEIGDYLQAAAILGRRTAGLHIALARENDSPEFKAESFSREDVLALATTLHKQAVRTFDMLKSNLAKIPDDSVEPAGTLLSRRRSILAGLRAAENLQPESLRIRIHGDYHLGQVLRVEDDFVILDFEGEPARPLSERRAKTSPLKDVASMLRSFSYAAHEGASRAAAMHKTDLDAIEPWMRVWESGVSTAFFENYRSAVAGTDLLPREESESGRLLRLYLLDKALYELRYELDNRPSWVRIPLWGIMSLLAQEGIDG